MLGVLRNLGCCSKVGEDARHHWCQYNPIWWFLVLCSMLCLLPGLWFHTCFGQGGWRAMTMTTTHSGMSESDMTPRKKCYNSCVLLSWPGLHVHTVDDSVQHNEHERNTKGLVKTTMVHTSSTSIRFVRLMVGGMEIFQSDSQRISMLLPWFFCPSQSSARASWLAARDFGLSSRVTSDLQDPAFSWTVLYKWYTSGTKPQKNSSSNDMKHASTRCTSRKSDQDAAKTGTNFPLHLVSGSNNRHSRIRRSGPDVGRLSTEIGFNRSGTPAPWRNEARAS